MNKTALIVITVGLVIGLGIIFLGGPKANNNTRTNNSPVSSIQNTEIKDGIQYITINVKGGYSPKISIAKAGIPTKLIMKTNGSYDCSLSLVIRSIGFQKILQKTGEEIIDIGTPKAGVPLKGICGMGMYSFEIQFQ